ncbi:MarR family winged helix-turn-helix transcriptional regulator [Nocardia sp. NPDC052278]|uniref:MarR family winged helix-turn-helix transcriptional regulator n=1 Tax=unclassified Nocardia TaxID=2637762 RepID=UPI0036CF1827
MTHRSPSPEELAALSHVPLIAASFRHARNDMPESLRGTFQEYGLGPRHGAVMVQLLACHTASVSDLAHRLHVSLSTASELTGDLSRAGLLTRNEDPANRRRTLVSAPEHVRSIFEEFLTVRSAALLKAIAQLSSRDREGFLVGLREWAEQEEAAITARHRRPSPGAHRQ